MNSMQAQGIPLETEKFELGDFVYEMADKLIQQSIHFLESPNYAGVDLAIFMLLDAQKYLSLHPCAKGKRAESLLHAAQKFNEWNTAHYGNR